jgi:hypothetical protein
MLSARPTSPVSPTPGINFGATFTSTFRPDSEEPVEVYQDQDSEEHSPLATTPKQSTPACDGTPTPKGPAFIRKDVQSFVSEHDDFSEHDEENDPIVHSFGPFGDNIMSRLESFQSSSPDRKRKPLKAATKSPRRSESAPNFNPSPIKNHVINQLAFSRIHSLPLSTIHSNLPTELRGAIAKPCDGETKDVLTTADLKNLLHAIPCVGEISREGKDAAGKLLESEFYYVPEMDTDANRRDTVTQSLGKTSIRAARKQHKVCRSCLSNGLLLTSHPAILLEATTLLNAILPHRNVGAATKTQRNPMSIFMSTSLFCASIPIPLHSESVGFTKANHRVHSMCIVSHGVMTAR